MLLPETIQQLHCLLVRISKDLVKVQRGNKAASQRVRTGTIMLERIAKVFRKESIYAEKVGKFKKKSVFKKNIKRSRFRKKKR